MVFIQSSSDPSHENAVLNHENSVMKQAEDGSGQILLSLLGCFL